MTLRRWVVLFLVITAALGFAVLAGAEEIAKPFFYISAVVCVGLFCADLLARLAASLDDDG